MTANNRSASFLPPLFGMFNIAFVVIGISVEIQELASGGAFYTDSTPYVNQAFYIMSAANVSFLFALALSGYRLMRYGDSAIRFSNIVFTGEILYMILTFLPWLFHGSVALSFIAADGIGNVGIEAQEIIAYPVFALLVLNLYVLVKKLRSVSNP